jgi:diguanylate cyclase
MKLQKKCQLQMNGKLFDMFNEMETIVENSGALIYVIDLETHEILFANKRCIEEFGHVMNKTCYKVLQKGINEPCSFCPLNQQIVSPLNLPLGNTYKWENENSINNFYYTFTSRIAKWKNGRTVNIQFGIDITEQKRLEKKLIEEKDDFIKTFEAIIDSTLEGIIVYDEYKNCIRVNQIASSFLGYTKEEMIGKSAFEFISPSALELVKKVIENDNQEPYESEMIRKDGTTFPSILRGQNLELLGNKIRISALIDNTETKRKEKQILELAHYDSLTRIPNRLLFKELFLSMIKRINRNNYYGALLFIDLDHFKIVNDTKGHMIGDLVLIETVKRIQKVLRSSDLISRLGGDEFLVAIELNHENELISIHHVNIIANKILSEIRQAYLISGFDFRLSASIGIVLFKDEYEIDELLRFSDIAMYSSKDKGRDTFTYFDPKLQQIIEEKADLIKLLREAVENNSMVIYYQLQISSKNNYETIIGVEALVRWIDKEKGVIGPDKFISLAEETGLIIPLGKWILETTISQIKQWETDEIKKYWCVSINISSKQFEEINFVNIVKLLIQKYNINPSKLRLELTENLLFKNTEESINKINELSSMGITLSIDDFGTGYSSLSYLKQLSIDELKIDKSFIEDLTTDSNDYIIVETMISIADKFNLELIAEGVETKEQFEKLKSMGCKYFQGYLFAKPVPLSELI